MAHSFRAHYFHLVWSTKNRVKSINPEIKSRMYNYIRKIVKRNQSNLIEIGGFVDHIHLLVCMESLSNYEKLIRDIKSSSTRWIHNTFPNQKNFYWQDGYGSFTISYSATQRVRLYIQDQENHHKKFSFKDEFDQLLLKHDIRSEPKYVFG